MSFARDYATEAMHCDGAATFYPLTSGADGVTSTNTLSSLVDPDATGTPIVGAHVHNISIAVDSGAAADFVTATFESHDGTINYGFFSGAGFANSGMNSQTIYVNFAVKAVNGFRIVTTNDVIRVTVMWSPIGDTKAQQKLTGAATTSV